MMSLTRYPSVGFSEATVAAINTGICGNGAEKVQREELFLS